jgi:hypothetical protein
MKPYRKIDWGERVKRMRERRGEALSEAIPPVPKDDSMVREASRPWSDKPAMSATDSGMGGGELPLHRGSHVENPSLLFQYRNDPFSRGLSVRDPEARINSDPRWAGKTGAYPDTLSLMRAYLADPLADPKIAGTIRELMPKESLHAKRVLDHDRASENAQKLLQALQKHGSVSAIGGMIYSPDLADRVLMSNTDMHAAVRELELGGIKVRRQDAGGRPTWAIEEDLPFSEPAGGPDDPWRQNTVKVPYDQFDYSGKRKPGEPEAPADDEDEEEEKPVSPRFRLKFEAMALAKLVLDPDSK